MVTVRTYWNLAEAALAKTLLDNYEIPCELLDENASCYNTGQQFAVPIRLVVDEDHAPRAISILSDDFENAAEPEADEEPDDTQAETATSVEAMNRNPWELLVLAFYLLLPAICVLRIPVPSVSTRSSTIRYLIALGTVSHFLSWLAIIFAAVLIALYFQVRRSSRTVQEINSTMRPLS